MMKDVRIALLRGINVGGHGRLPMADLRKIVSDLGGKDISTYIQSGNVVFRGDLQGDAISDAVEARFGFRRPCIVLPASEVLQILEATPFDFAEPKDMHYFFLDRATAVDGAALDEKCSPLEAWQLGERVLYLHSPGGLSKSKLASFVDRLIPVPVTARNWNSVRKLCDMASAV